MDVSLIVITYKVDPAILRTCLTSIANSVGLAWECIVIDNAGDSSVLQMLSEVIPRSTCIINSENKGFAGAVNQGIAKAQGRYVVLLNPDTSFDDTVLARTMAHMDADADVVGVGSVLMQNVDGTLQESIRRFPKLSDQLAILFKIPHVLRRNNAIDSYMMRDCDPHITQDVDSIMGAFMWIPRHVLEKVGTFDERFFLWFEEVDYCKRVVDAGYKVRHYADIIVTHHKGHSFSRVGFIRKQRWIRQSMRKFFYKHYGFWQWLVLWLLAPVFILLAYIGWIALAVKKRT